MSGDEGVGELNIGEEGEDVSKPRSSALGREKDENLQDFKTEQYTFRRGVAFIAFNCDTDSSSRPHPRTPAYANDAHRISTLFTKMGFDVRGMHRDLKAAALEFELRSFAAEEDFTDVEALIFVFLSTGSARGAASGADGFKVAIGNLISLFSGHMCPTLKGKPKVFLVHTVRSGLDAETLTAADREAVAKITVPDDCLFFYSSVPNAVAWDASGSILRYVAEILSKIRQRAGNAM